MSVEKFSVSFDPDLGRAIREAADDDDESVSAWLAEAARARLRTLVLGQALDGALRDLGLSEEEVLDAARLARARAVTVPAASPSRRAARSPRVARSDTAPRTSRAATKKAVAPKAAAKRRAG